MRFTYFSILYNLQWVRGIFKNLNEIVKITYYINEPVYEYASKAVFDQC